MNGRSRFSNGVVAMCRYPAQMENAVQDGDAERHAATEGNSASAPSGVR
jgi:hypothetical protein